MKTRILIIFIAVSFFWLAFSLLVNVFFVDYLMNKIVFGLLPIGMIVHGVNLLRNISKSETRFNPDDLSVTIPLFFGIALIEIVGGYFQQVELTYSENYNVFLVSGVGLMMILVAYLIVARYNHNIN